MVELPGCLPQQPFLPLGTHWQYWWHLAECLWPNPLELQNALLLDLADGPLIGLVVLCCILRGFFPEGWFPLFRALLESSSALPLWLLWLGSSIYPWPGWTWCPDEAQLSYVVVKDIMNIDLY